MKKCILVLAFLTTSTAFADIRIVKSRIDANAIETHNGEIVVMQPKYVIGAEKFDISGYNLKGGPAVCRSLKMEFVSQDNVIEHLDYNSDRVEFDTTGFRIIGPKDRYTRTNNVDTVTCRPL